MQQTDRDDAAAGESDAFDELYMHPSAQRAALVRSMNQGSVTGGHRRAPSVGSNSGTASVPINKNWDAVEGESASARTPLIRPTHYSDNEEHTHEHTHSSYAGGDHSHSHGGGEGSMNARGVFLHGQSLFGQTS